jgi:hypothetical protein
MKRKSESFPRFRAHIVYELQFKIINGNLPLIPCLLRTRFPTRLGNGLIVQFQNSHYFVWKTTTRNRYQLLHCIGLQKVEIINKRKISRPFLIADRVLYKHIKYVLLISSLTLYDLHELRPVTPLTNDRRSFGVDRFSFSFLDLPGTSSRRS